MAVKDIYLRIETIDDYSPVEPQDKAPPPIQYKRDGMRNEGHMNGIIPDAERDARALKAVVYRQYKDPDYLVPYTNKMLAADVNEPIWEHRVPGCTLWVYVGDEVNIHVFNAHNVPHSFHIHGLEFGIDSDGAWPMGTQTSDGRRSDEICPGQDWTYRFNVEKGMIGAWPFHDHSSHMSHGSVDLGLFGGLIVREKPNRFLVPSILDKNFEVKLRKDLVLKMGDRPLKRDALNHKGELVLEDHFERLREGAFREQLLFPYPIKSRTIHAPVYFHKMMAKESTPTFDSGDLEENGAGSFSHVFDDPGSYGYFCTFHPMMTGSVEVVAGAAASVTVNILDNPQMGFYPDSVQIAPGGTVNWVNMSFQHHTVTSVDGASMPTHCINGRGFVGNSPTIIAKSKQKIKWYVFNLDFSHEFHNFHLHNQRWDFAGETVDVRSLSPAESFTLETVAPTVLLLPDHIKEIQASAKRPKIAEKFRLMGDFIFHCHVHHHMKNGMIGVVRSYQDVWLTPAMKQELEDERGIILYDPSNPIPHVDMNRCQKMGDGEWEELSVTPDVTFMHACLMPKKDKVLYWGYTRADQSRIYDPAGPSVNPPANQATGLPGMSVNDADLWSAEHAFINDADGSILAHGGFAGPSDNHSFIFDSNSEDWSQTSSTTNSRFYSTTISLHDGRALTLFGSSTKSIEVYDPVPGNWSAPVALPANMGHHRYYPWTYELPDGKLFIAGPHHPTQKFDWDPVANIEDFNTILNDTRSTGAEKGTSAMLPLRPPFYDVRIVIAGGSSIAARKTSEIINISSATPAWQSLPDLNEERADQVQSILLPNGYLAVVGGANAVAGGGPVELLDANNVSAGWQRGPNMTHHRGYHSAGILLKDGSILVGGDPSSHTHERYRPGYFFEPRPIITTSPASTNYGATISIDTPQASSISEVILMRPGAVTHGFNMSQRAIECAIVGGNAAQVDIELPPSGFIAPPGWYLLFILNNNRVPSEGEWIRVS